MVTQVRFVKLSTPNVQGTAANITQYEFYSEKVNALLTRIMFSGNLG